MPSVSRAGRYLKQPEGYRAFVPAPLPPEPPLAMDAELIRLLDEAGTALGRLDGAASVLPNPDLFVAMYVRHEAVLSSQIEGTQSTLEDVLEFEVDGRGRERVKDVQEVVNYVHAMNHGLERMETLPVSLRLLREIHELLLSGVRGRDKTPGEFRRSQNWIGPGGSALNEAEFVPPPVHEMNQALHDFESFLHESANLPPLIHCGLAHAQFETIHPFLDGNGRVGRLLITFLLCWRGTLHRPLLYISHYLKAHRAQYYDRLQAVRNDGDWEGWLKFFLRGVREVAGQATDTARAILDLREKHRQTIHSKGTNSGAGLVLLDRLFQSPFVTVRMAQSYVQSSFGTANKLVGQFVQWGLLDEVTGQQRNRLFQYKPYMALFAPPQSAGNEETPPKGAADEGEA